MGLWIGGIIPALLLGVFGVLQKASNKAGISIGMYLVVSGIAVTVTGLLYLVVVPDKSITGRAAVFTLSAAVCWCVAMALVQYAITGFDIEISRLVPLYNMNTLVAVILGLVVFSEWENLNLSRMLVGSICIVAGGILVAKS